MKEAGLTPASFIKKREPEDSLTTMLSILKIGRTGKTNLAANQMDSVSTTFDRISL